MRSRSVLAVATVVAVVLGVLFAGAPALAVVGPGAPGQGDSAAAEIRIVGTESGGQVRGNLEGIPVNPISYPGGQATGRDQFAALIVVQDVASGLESRAYCVDFVTGTYLGVRYSSSDWSTGGVANSSYITYILTHYFPFVPNQPGGATDRERVEAVQSAIWFFSDGWVLTDSAAARPLTQQIVADAIANGGSTPPPPPPALVIDPTTASAPDSDPAAGPFTVSGSDALVESVTGLQLFQDAARTVPAPVGTPVAAGTRLWAGGVQQQVPPASITVGSSYSVPVGTLYVADPNPDGYQKIVLARTDTLPVRATASVSLYPANTLTLVKRVGGAAAGAQSAITLTVSCTPQPAANVTTTFSVPSRAPAGDYTFAVSGLPVGATCTVTEPVSGANANALLSSSTITPQSVTIPAPAAGSPVVTVIDTFSTGGAVSPANGNAALAATGGSDAAVVWSLGGVLIATGVLMVLLRRRRRLV